MSSDNRGWNIILGKARSSIVASLLGRSRDGEVSLLGWLLIAVVVSMTAYLLFL
jgi:hypothetical protein